MGTWGEFFCESYRPGFQPTAPQLLAVVDLWEMYPYHLGAYQTAVRAARQHRDQIAVEVLGDESGAKVIPVVDTADPTSKQLALPIDGLTAGFQFVPLVIQGARITTPANYDAHQQVLWVNEFALPVAQLEAEGILCPELERRGLDGSALVSYGRVCRNVCEKIKGLGPQKSRWPRVAAAWLDTLHQTELDAVLQAEQNLIRLRTQLTLDRPTTHKLKQRLTPPTVVVPSGRIFSG
jgi:hypothetical protein